MVEAGIEAEQLVALGSVGPRLGEPLERALALEPVDLAGALALAPGADAEATGREADALSVA